jgi:hypothetical protein
VQSSFGEQHGAASAAETANQSLQSRAGRDEAYKELDVLCFVALLPAADGPSREPALDACGALLAADAEASAMLLQPAASAQLHQRLGSGRAGPSSSGSWVVGTLDLNVGHTLPSEELSGRLPKVWPAREACIVPRSPVECGVACSGKGGYMLAPGGVAAVRLYSAPWHGCGLAPRLELSH